jgi:hypothetical protein
VESGNSIMTDEDFDVEAFLTHEGVLRRSGRYPWGSGANPNQRNKSFLDHVNDLKKKGMSEADIAKGLGLESTTQLRALRSRARSEVRKAEMLQALRLRDKGMSLQAIADRMGLSGESQVRALLNPEMRERNDKLESTMEMLRQQVAEKKYLDIGVGTEHHLGVTNQRMKTAIASLEEEGYKEFYVPIKQLGTGKITNTKVLAPPGTKFPEVMANQDKIRGINAWTEDQGKSWTNVLPPLQINPKRVAIRYADEGGDTADGVIEIRRGVNDLSMGGARYAQVRVAVGGTHYLKGMAMYADDLPAGVDIRFNTNKMNTGNKLDAMKKLQDDPDNPFGTVIRQRTSPDGKKVTSALNIVNEEGNWSEWSSKLSSQFLSKQPPGLAKQQLDLRFKEKQAELDDIMALTNPTVRKVLLEKFADGADSSSVHLKAAGLPRTRSHVILPINSLKDNEIYAPNYRNGEKVVLVRHPHGGKFELPELVVNNKNKDAQRLVKNAVDAVGINSNVAKRLSGADFDGDTVLVIPNNSGKVKTQSPLQGLKDFDPQQYKLPDSAPKMTARNKQLKMGDVSNLITDMTIKGANDHELAAAVRHSMVVIDAEKHHLDYKASARDNGIAGLKLKYQARPDGTAGGASTLISRASSRQDVPLRKPRPAKDGGPIDAATGEKVWVYTNESYTSKRPNKNGDIVEKEVIKTFRSTKMAETKDARTLSSGRPVEEVYATYANSLKSMANAARKTAVTTKAIPYSPSAKKAFGNEVKTLNAKLNEALKHAPLERQAQNLANTMVRAKKANTPDLDPADLKKIESQALTQARLRVSGKSGRPRVVITPSEWKAIQAGAISNNKLTQILNNADLDAVKALATPRDRPVMNDAKIARAQAMLAAGHTQADVADALGVPTSTLNSAIGSG